jgi:hypothetical protein
MWTKIGIRLHGKSQKLNNNRRIRGSSKSKSYKRNNVKGFLQMNSTSRRQKRVAENKSEKCS